jgi:tetratricopeptide (TPR) repeat protein
MMADNKIFEEVKTAFEAGDLTRARDLLTRLLKKDRNNITYWIWMSAVVPTEKEREFCLREVLRLDPKNQIAQRGLSLLGAMPADPTLQIPYQRQKQKWQMEYKAIEAEKIEKPKIGLKPGQIIAMAAVTILLVVLMVIGVNGLVNQPRETVVYTRPTLLPMANTPTPRPTPTFVGPTPLWMMLDAPYTPTPLYVNTPHPRTESYRSGIVAYNQGDWKELEVYMRQVSTVEPANPDIYYYIGESYRNREIFDQAIYAYNLAMEMDSNFAPAYLGRGRARLQDDPGRWKVVQQDWQKALSLDPNMLDTYLELAALDIELKEGQSAVDYLNTAVEIAPESFLVYLYRAEAHLLIDEYELAYEDAIKARSLDETALPAYRLIGETSYAGGFIDVDEMVRSLSTYVVFEEEDWKAWAWLGAAYRINGETDAARDALNQSLVLNRNQSTAFYERGVLYFELGEADKAIRDLEGALGYPIALGLDDKFFPLYIYLGRAYLMAEDDGNAYQQLSVAEAYAETDADWAQIYYWRAQALTNMDNMDVAERNWEMLLELAEDEVPYEWRQKAREELGIVAKAPTARPTRTPTATPTPEQDS